MGILDRLRSDSLGSFDVSVGNLQLRISAAENLRDEARIVALKHWEQLEAYIAGHSSFKTSFVPMPVGPGAPAVVRSMGAAAEAAGVGPMLTLPGAMAEAVARDLSQHARNVIVSTEGDTFAMHHRAQTSYFPCTGQKQATKDENDIIAVPARAGTTYSYADPMLRLTMVQRKDSSGQITSETDYAYTDTVNAVTVTTSTKQEPALRTWHGRGRSPAASPQFRARIAANCKSAPHRPPRANSVGACRGRRRETTALPRSTTSCFADVKSTRRRGEPSSRCSDERGTTS